jgi:di/tricarboxylate transporter
MAGLMAVTGFLSMWINNAATASIMLPVVMAITEELDRHGKEYHDKKRAIKEATAAVNGKRMKTKKINHEKICCLQKDISQQQ